MEENLLTTNELCKIYKFSRTTLEKYRKKKGFPYIRKGRSVYFILEDVQRWMDETYKAKKFNYKETSAN